MGKGQRHSKNAGTMGSEALTYHEKRALGFGTVRERVGKDSQGNFYDCCLTLQAAVDPVITTEGYIFSREAILENLLGQKKIIKRKTAAWEAQETEQQQQAAEKAAVEEHAKLIAFDRQNHMGMSESTAAAIRSTLEEEAAHMHEEKGASTAMNIHENEKRLKELKAFWLPSLAPSAKIRVEKPDQHTYCPASGKKLRLKDLIPVRFTAVPEGETGRYMDPITKDTFTNSSRLVVLRPTGDVLLRETWEKCIKPEGHYEGKRIKEADVIEIKAGGTGFAARDGKKLEVEQHFALGPGSGLADLRGQHQGAPSRGGLVFMN